MTETIMSLVQVRQVIQEYSAGVDLAELGSGRDLIPDLRATVETLYKALKAHQQILRRLEFKPYPDEGEAIEAGQVLIAQLEHKEASHDA